MTSNGFETTAATAPAILPIRAFSFQVRSSIGVRYVWLSWGFTSTCWFNRLDSIVDNFVEQISDEKMAGSGQNTGTETSEQSSHPVALLVCFTEDSVHAVSSVEVQLSNANVFSSFLDSSLDQIQWVGDRGSQSTNWDGRDNGSWGGWFPESFYFQRTC